MGISSPVGEFIKSTTLLKLAHQVATRAHFMQVSDYEGRKIFGGKGFRVSKMHGRRLPKLT